MTTNPICLYSNSINASNDEKFVEANYNVVLFSTEDGDSVSLPYVYLVPKEIQLPREISQGFFRCTYDTDGDETGSSLGKWLKENAIAVLKPKSFVCAVNERIAPEFENTLPKFV